MRCEALKFPIRNFFPSPLNQYLKETKMIHMVDDDNDGDDGFLPPSMNKRISMMMLLIARRIIYELTKKLLIEKLEADYSPSLLNFVRG